MSNKHSIPTFEGSKQRIVVCTNSLANTPYECYTNHCQMWFQFGRNYRNIEFAFANPPRMSIDRAKNMAAKTAMEIGASHLLIIDDDVLMPPPFDFLEKLLALKAPIAAADVIIRGWPFAHMMFRYDKKKTGLNPIKTINKYGGKLEVDAVGFSCVLIETDLLLKLAAPLFITGDNHTEDIYFCMKARDKFPELKIIVDTSIQCAHILWPEMISEANLKQYKLYFKSINPSIKLSDQVDKDARNRGTNYYNLVKAYASSVENLEREDA